jgi:hypothetical protein
MIDMKKTFEFRRNDSEKGRRLKVEVELTDDNNFRVCCAGPAIYWGQCIEEAGKELNINDPVFKKIAKFHSLYHLSDMKAGLPIQEKAVKEYTKDNPYDYTKVCEYLESKDLLVVDGYKYGTAWLCEPIPADDLEAIKALFES